MTTTLDLRGDYARLNPPKDLPPLEFDLTGAHALVGVIKLVTDGMRSAGRSDLSRKAAMRVAGRVYVRAMESGNRDAAMHAWKRLCGLILSRPREEVMAMEKRMGVRM